MGTPERTVGNWYVYLAVGANHWDRTVLGVAVYDGAGGLAGSHFSSHQRAVLRGDLPDGFVSDRGPVAPADEAAMRRRLQGAGNTMSCLQWTGPMPTRVREGTAAEILETLIGRDGRPSPGKADAEL